MLNSENNKNLIVIEGLFQYSLFIKLISLVVLDLHETWSFSLSVFETLVLMREYLEIS
jgi:hypothetical protein